MIKAMIEGECDQETLAKLAKGRLRSKHDQLVESLEGRINQDDRWVMKELWEQIEYLNKEIAHYDDQIKEKMSPYEELLKLLMTIDLIERRSAENFLAEIGPDMSFFPSDYNLVRSGPGCVQGATNRQKRTEAEKCQKRSLASPSFVGTRWGASRRKDGYLGAMYQELCCDAGKNGPSSP
ncbi:MAG: hypothetical protein J2P21_18675 [Chloracidobacterium sp.]|nr:hypothetical protein [Chloracidobacterium sp.]